MKNGAEAHCVGICRSPVIAVQLMGLFYFGERLKALFNASKQGFLFLNPIVFIPFFYFGCAFPLLCIINATNRLFSKKK
jgi:hypothetical protein